MDIWKSVPLWKVYAGALFKAMNEYVYERIDKETYDNIIRRLIVEARVKLSQEDWERLEGFIYEKTMLLEDIYKEKFGKELKI